MSKTQRPRKKRRASVTVEAEKETRGRLRMQALLLRHASLKDSPLELVFSSVLQNPGCTKQQAQHQAGVSEDQFNRSLKILQDTGRLLSVQRQTIQRLFPVWPGTTNQQSQVLQKKNPRILLAILLSKGPMPRSQFLVQARQALKLSTRSTESYLSILANAGLVEGRAGASQDRRHIELHAVDLDFPLQRLVFGLEADAPA